MRKLPVILILLFTLCCKSAFTLTYVVDTNGDADDGLAYTASDGTNTLKKCIRLANANAGADIINFNLPGSTVIANSACGGGWWYSITDQLTIDGYTQAGAAAGAPVVELSGGAMGCWATLSLEAGSSGSVIRGLIIHGTNLGIRIDAASTGNTISGNWIGVDNTGNAIAANPITEHGIRVESSNNNLIGGTGGTIDRNVIAGCNWQAVRVEGTSSGNEINGNYIGISNSGTVDLGCGQMGLFFSNCTNCVVGGGAANEGNVISGNGQEGIYMENCDNFTIKGNIIGLGADTNTAIANSNSGISITNASDIGEIGGSGAAERNYISSNGDNGVRLDNSDNITIQGNYIGVASDGATDRGNTNSGIYGVNVEFLEIGGAVAGEGNLISGNGPGITINGATSNAATIRGNIIGLAADTATQLINGGNGISLTFADNSQIGGTTVEERNYISRNSFNGILLSQSDGTTILGNYIGVDGTGLVDMGNGGNGIRVVTSVGVTIGGTTYASRNIISGNSDNGIALDGASTGAIIKANIIGLGGDGATVVNNDNHGIYILGTSDNATIGGPTTPERNFISGNGQFTVGVDPDNGIIGDAIRATGPGGHTIQNNYLGTDTTGTIGAGNHWAGISLNSSDNNDILDNLISDNRNEGIWIDNSDNNEIYRNTIGVGTDGSNLGNWDYGVIIFGTSQSNIIGGSAANANTIAYTRGERPTDGDGVTIGGTAGDFNEVTFNSIYCNLGEGIVRDGTSNENVAVPVISASNPNDINGTGDNGHTIHIYRNTTTGSNCNCEGEIYVGTTTVAGGVWSFTHNLGLSAAEAQSVSATQTTTNNSTSAFAACSAPMPVNYGSIKLVEESEGLSLTWITAQEINNSHFIIQVSKDGYNFIDIGVVQGMGNSNQPLFYSFLIDEQYIETALYIRIEQVDFDGTAHISPMLVHNHKSSSNMTIAGNTIHIGLEDPAAELSILSLEGKSLQTHYMEGKGYYSFRLNDLASSIYIVRLNTRTEIITDKVFINE